MGLENVIGYSCRFCDEELRALAVHLRADLATAKEQQREQCDRYVKAVALIDDAAQLTLKQDRAERDEAIAARAETERKLAEAHRNVSDNVQTIGRLDAECLRLRNRAEAAERAVVGMREALVEAREFLGRIKAAEFGNVRAACEVIDHALASPAPDGGKVEKMRAALEAARGEITRMATDGGGFSCSVIDEIDKALNGAAKAALEAVSDEKQTTDYSI